AGMAMHMPTILSPAGRGGGDLPPQLAPPFSYAVAKKNYDTELHELREFFEEARRYQKAKAANTKGFQPDLKFEALLPVLDGTEPLVVMANRERAIHDAVHFA